MVTDTFETYRQVVLLIEFCATLRQKNNDTNKAKKEKRKKD